MVFGSSSFPSIYSLPKVGHQDQAAEWIHRRERAKKSSIASKFDGGYHCVYYS